jgi:hypothetical protein
MEVFKHLEKRLISALTLVGIAFIYIGFSWHDITSLVIVVFGVVLFLGLSYFGYKKNFNLIILGLVLHGIWDFLFPFFSSVTPQGYDIFCITIDFILAIYFYFRVNHLKKPKISNF